MEIVVIGSGSCIPVLHRRQAATLFASGEERILVDCGNGALTGLLAAGVSPYDLDHIMLTHFHADHTSDLISFFAAMNFEPASPRTRALALYGRTGLREFVHALCAPYPGIAPQHYELHVHETEDSPFSIGAFHVTPGFVRHAESSLGYRIRRGDRTAVITGDTGPSPQAVALAREADLLLCECSHPSGTETENHLTPATAGELARDANVRSVCLTHLYPHMEKEPIVEHVRRAFAGDVVVARDLLKLTL